MFRSTKESADPEVQSQQAQLTGVERAKLERAVAPPAPRQAPPPPPPQQPKAVAPAPTVRPQAPAPKAPPAGNTTAQLIAGPGVTLKGDVLNCDLLRVEGTIEGDIKARKLIISAGGTLLGTAQIDEAEIEGRFEGTLGVTGLLVVRSTGRVIGKFAYGDIEIERGGEIAGEVQVSKQSKASSGTRPPAPKPVAIPPQAEEPTTLRAAVFARS